jgi:hypothetical protein
VKAGDLFVELGMKGDGAFLQGMGAISEGMFGAFAGAQAVVDSIEAVLGKFAQLAQASSENALGLQQFSNATGLSASKLQSLQNALLHFGGVNPKETLSAVESAQSAMTKLLMNEGSSKLGIIAQYSHGFDPKKAMTDTYYMVNKLREFAKAVPAQIGLSVFRDLGLGENFFGALRKSTGNLFNFNLLSRNTDAQLAKLSQIQIEWEELGITIGHAFDQFNLQHGEQIVDTLKELTTALIGMFNTIIGFLNALDAFGWIKDMAETFRGLNALPQSASKTPAFAPEKFNPAAGVDLQRLMNQIPQETSVTLNVNTNVKADSSDTIRLAKSINEINLDILKQFSEKAGRQMSQNVGK